MISEKLKKFRQKVKERQGGTNDNAVFPFWNIPFDSSATVRLLPFEDHLTEMFWTEKKIIRMNFVDPNNEDKLIRFEAPCYEMFAKDHKCPILQPVRDLYGEAKELKNAGDTEEATRLEKVAGQHWIKPTFYYQGFVVKSGLVENEVPENPIRIFPMSKQVHQVIFTKVMSEEEDGFEIFPTGEFTMDDINELLSEGDMPEDEIERLLARLDGINFILKKTKQGEHANYQSSSWATNPTTLEEDQIEALNKHGLHDLRARLPRQPTDEQYQIMTDMVNISIGRLLGTDDGYWDQAWTDAGIEPRRDRNQASGSGDAKAASKSSRNSGTASKLRSQLSKATKTDDADTPASDDGNVSNSVMSKVLKNRGAKDKPSADSKAETAPAKADLAARIRGGLRKNAKA